MELWKLAWGIPVACALSCNAAPPDQAPWAARQVYFVVISDPHDPDVVARRSDPRGLPRPDSVHIHPHTGESLEHLGDPDAYFQAEVEVINRWMVDEQGAQLCDEEGCLEHEFAGAMFYEEFAGLAGEGECAELLAFGDTTTPGHAADCEDQDPRVCGPEQEDIRWTDAFSAAVEACTHPELRRPDALTVFVIDKCNWPKSNGNCARYSSNGRMRFGDVHGPYVVASYERLLRGEATGDRAEARGLEQHEIGHTLGLDHTGECPSDFVTASNPMERGTGCSAHGDRARGFAPEVLEVDGDVVDQIAVMLAQRRAEAR